jgi:hypothetical protein
MPDIKARMVFQKSDGKNFTLSVSNADPVIDDAAINAAMNAILAKNVFAPDALDLVAKVSGELITTTTNEFIMSSI